MWARTQWLPAKFAECARISAGTIISYYQHIVADAIVTAGALVSKTSLKLW
jgi:hypothetical protein